MKTTPTPHILLVEDDKYFRMAIKDILHKFGVVYESSSLSCAHNRLKQQKFDLAVVDIHLGDDPQGLEVLSLAKKVNVPSIILSSCGDDDITERAYAMGCEHFLVKRHYRKHLEQYVQQMLKKRQEPDLQELLNRHFPTTDQSILDQLEKIHYMSLQNKSLFISGETGVGKSHLGKLIHQLHFDEKAPFVHLNCSELSQGLLEAELFGHMKGAFTGAHSDKQGKLAQANGGVLFLDEIATMPMKMQQKLLKAIDEKTFYPVGSEQPIKCSFTLISATCDNLDEMIEKKKFRKDLYYRIAGIKIHIPPLRERIEDIELIIKHQLKKSPRRIVIKQEVFNELKSHDWPGNTRELIKAAEQFMEHDKGVITINEIPKLKRSHSDSELESKTQWPLTPNLKDYIKEHGLKSYIQMIEQKVIKAALERNNGKKAQTIKELKVSSSAFYRVLNTLK